MGEFGRTPKVNPAGGRDHRPVLEHPHGRRPDQGRPVVGESDEIGAPRRTGRPRRAEVAATIYKGLGLDPHAEFPGAQGRPIPLVDRGFDPIEELFSMIRLVLLCFGLGDLHLRAGSASRRLELSQSRDPRAH